MMRLRILNVEAFLSVVNACRGAVYLLARGEKLPLNGNKALQARLRGEHRRQGGVLTLALDAPDPSDYMALVSYYAGDC